ncbi:Zinc finger and SCAN domain-containing protein 18 [Tupaia chinensis]|uniref:Zinc finger and SCAN domain-containing protein 18 n=1 Tax=Tupaia chinensis TaxID=246437 RepID=L8Y8S6_TUPCH|nr:Zinc finger and SCAN domain-containing protein 18 [Tupaia chinensis]
MLLGSPTGSSAFSEELCEKYAEPLLLPCEPTSPFTGPQETLALLETRWQALDPRLPEQGNIREDVQEEFKPAKVQLKKPKLLEETLGEWGHLDPAEENLRSYRKLLLWGSGRQQNKGNTCEGVSEPRVWTERFAGDSPVNPSSGITQEEEEQPWNVPDPQDGELSTVTVAQRQSVIQKPAQDRGGARLTTVPQGLGVKRPHPEDKGGQDSQYIPRVSCHLPHDIGKEHNASCHSAGSLAGQDPASCPRDDKLGVSGRKPCYTCSECGQIFTWISHLMEHQRNHNGRKRYACQSCWKTFHFSLALAEHQKIHEKEKGYTFGVGLGSHPAAREAYAGGRLGGLPEYVGGDVFPGQPEAQR